MAGLFSALYPREGGAPRAYACNSTKCARVTRTAAGMVKHLWLRHGVRMQGELFGDRLPERPRTASRQESKP